jgi:hypothetical protein
LGSRSLSELCLMGVCDGSCGIRSRLLQLRLGQGRTVERTWCGTSRDKREASIRVTWRRGGATGARCGGVHEPELGRPVAGSLATAIPEHHSARQARPESEQFCSAAERSEGSGTSVPREILTACYEPYRPKPVLRIDIGQTKAILVPAFMHIRDAQILTGQRNRHHLAHPPPTAHPLVPRPRRHHARAGSRRRRV